MPNIYAVIFDQITAASASGDYDFTELTAADDAPLTVLGWDFSQKSEVGDAQEEQVALSWGRGLTTSGNGTAVTPAPLGSLTPAAAFTAEYMASTPATTGTNVPLFVTNWNVRAGTTMFLPPEFRFSVKQGALLVARMSVALADDATMSGTIWVQEGV